MNSDIPVGSNPVRRTNSKTAFQPQTRAVMRFFLRLKISEKCLKLTKFATFLQLFATKFATKCVTGRDRLRYIFNSFVLLPQISNNNFVQNVESRKFAYKVLTNTQICDII